MCKLNDTNWVKEEIIEYFEINENKDTTCQYLLAEGKAVLNEEMWSYEWAHYKAVKISDQEPDLNYDTGPKKKKNKKAN